MKTSTKLKLFFRSLLTKFGAIETKGGRLVWDGEGELEVGTPVFVEADSEEGEIEYVAAADGEYEAEGKTIVVIEGVVTEIREDEKPAEEPAAEEPAEELEEAVEEPAAEEPVEEPAAPAYDAEAADAEMRARIEALEATVADLTAQLAALAAAPVAESAFSAAQDNEKKNEERAVFKINRK